MLYQYFLHERAKSPEKVMAIWVIGDIHGHSKQLEQLLDFLPLASDDTIVFLGDVIDRGPDSAGVLRQIHQLGQTHEVIFLRGNHEAMLLQARRSRDNLPFWIECGGGATLDSYRAKRFEDIPDEDWSLFETSRLYYETAEAIFVHANLDPNLPMNDQTESDLLWRFYNGPIHHRSGKFVVCGHTMQASGLPALSEHSVCIDTLPESGEGWLTAVDCARKTFWQVDHRGGRRMS